jgi:4-amino-4-deoxy-L-arabinose transferase-like glycosyltransferase
VRPYSLLAFLTAASVYCLLRAERIGKGGWWIAFTVSMVANLANSYMAVTLVLPALGPYLVWTIWRAWTRRHQEEQGHNLLFAILSLAVVGLVGVLMAIEVMRMPHVPTNWSTFSIDSLANMPVHLLTSFTNLGINNALGLLVSFVLLLVAVLGAYMGARQGYRQGVILCILFCGVPTFVLAILSASNMVFPRYILFVVPFYFLLMGAAVASTLRSYQHQRNSVILGRLLRAGGLVSIGLVCVLFLFGAFSYVNTNTHSSTSYRPDFRGVAKYLSDSAASQDVIIITDDPALGYNVTNFYWHYQPPAHLYDARDPLFFRQAVQGDVY